MPNLDDELIWKGAWDTGEAYTELDVVTSGATAYVCVDAHTSTPINAPPDADFWELLVEASVTDAYASVEEYRASIKKSDNARDLVIARHLATISRFIDRETGQYFNKNAAATTRIFKAKYWDCLDLWIEGLCPGIADVGGLAIKVDTDGDGSFADETAWSAGDYELLPRNAADGPEPQPWDRIEIPRWSSKRFQAGYLVEVTAIFGWPSVPTAIKDLTIELCGIWRGENPRATGRMNELDQVVTTSVMAMSLVKRIKEAYASARVTF